MSASVVLLTRDHHRWRGGSRDHVKHDRRMLHVRNSAFLLKNVKMPPSLSFCQDFWCWHQRFYSITCDMKQRQELSSANHITYLACLLSSEWRHISTAQLKTSEEAIKPSSPYEIVAFLLPRLKWCLIDSPCQWTRRLVMRCINECVGRD